MILILSSEVIRERFALGESYVDKTYMENLNGKTFKVYYVSKNELVIKCELESSVPYTGTVTVERISPDFDEGKIVEMQNRLWCCSSDKNEIYCCKQGDERNWQAYSDGISTDSWAMTCGTLYSARVKLLGFVP